MFTQCSHWDGVVGDHNESLTPPVRPNCHPERGNPSSHHMMIIISNDIAWYIDVPHLGWSYISYISWSSYPHLGWPTSTQRGISPYISSFILLAYTVVADITQHRMSVILAIWFQYFCFISGRNTEARVERVFFFCPPPWPISHSCLFLRKAKAVP